MSLTIKCTQESGQLKVEQIFFTKEFKEEFWRRYQEGESPRHIVEALGYDPDILGTARLSGIQINIQKQANRPGGFTEGKGRKKSISQSCTLLMKIRQKDDGKDAA